MEHVQVHEREGDPTALLRWRGLDPTARDVDRGGAPGLGVGLGFDLGVGLGFRFGLGLELGVGLGSTEVAHPWHSPSMPTRKRCSPGQGQGQG